MPTELEVLISHSVLEKLEANKRNNRLNLSKDDFVSKRALKNDKIEYPFLRKLCNCLKLLSNIGMEK